MTVLDNLVMYEVNHGENFDRRLNQGDFKLRFVKRFPVNDEDRLRYRLSRLTSVLSPLGQRRQNPSVLYIWISVPPSHAPYRE